MITNRSCEQPRFSQESFAQRREFAQQRRVGWLGIVEGADRYGPASYAC